MITTTKITLRNETEAMVWSDVYMNTIATRVDEFVNELPFGIKRKERDAIQIEAVRRADEAIRIYRSGL